MIVSKATKQISADDIANGIVLLIDKSLSDSSFRAVQQVRKKIKIRKVGHAGTLDPMATGLLVICTGKKTKQVNKYQEMPKVYSGVITLGKTTPSMDSETEPVEINSYSGIKNEDIEKVRNLLVGEISQMPPMYSALKHKGKSLYKYARKGIEIERQPRKVNIYEFDVDKVELPEIHFRIKCSKGTYIRVIADDFGKQLGCGAFLSKLRRTQIGEYKVDEALSLSELSEIEITDFSVT